MKPPNMVYVILNLDILPRDNRVTMSKRKWSKHSINIGTQVFASSNSVITFHIEDVVYWLSNCDKDVAGSLIIYRKKSDSYNYDSGSSTAISL